MPIEEFDDEELSEVNELAEARMQGFSQDPNVIMPKEWRDPGEGVRIEAVRALAVTPSIELVSDQVCTSLDTMLASVKAANRWLDESDNKAHEWMVRWGLQLKQVRSRASRFVIARMTEDLKTATAQVSVMEYFRNTQEAEDAKLVDPSAEYRSIDQHRRGLEVLDEDDPRRYSVVDL